MIWKTSGFELTKFLKARKSIKTCGFFKPAAPVMHTEHTVVLCNPHPSSAILSGVDRHLSSHLSSGLRGKGYRYHAVYLSSFASIFSCNLYSLDFSGYTTDPCSYPTCENCQQNANTVFGVFLSRNEGWCRGFLKHMLSKKQTNYCFFNSIFQQLPSGNETP